MDSERSADSGAQAALWSTVQTDPWVRAALAAFTVTVALYLLPVLSGELRALLSRAAGPFVFLCLVVGALTTGVDRLTDRERRFWHDVTAAFCALLAVSALYLIFPRFEKPLALDLAVETLYAIYYAALVLAAEQQPDRSYRWRPAVLERALAWPAVTAFVLALFFYFIIIPILGGGASESWASSFALYLTLDAYLTARFLSLSRGAASSRWRTLYLVLGLTTGAVFFTDLLELSFYAGTPARWGAALDLVYYTPYLLIVLARSRHARFREDGAPPAGEERPEIHFTRLSGRTTIHALALPLLHLGGYAAGLFAAAHQAARGVLIFFAVLLLGSIAAIQHRMLAKRARELWHDREKVEATLRRNEKDLRMMVERYHTDRKLRLSEEKLAMAFRICPDALLITSLPDGRIKEVNDGFELITGYCREDALERTVVELDLWADPEDRERMRQTLEQQGSVRGFEARFRRRSGAIMIGQFAAEKLSIDGEPYLLSITHDISERKRIEDKLKTQAILLNQAQDAILVLDLEDRITYWNRSAERLYGWSAAEAIGRLATELIYAEGSQQVLETSARVRDQGDWTGEMQQVTKDRREIVVESWWTLVRDSDGNAISKLVISTDAATRKTAPEPLDIS